MLLIIFGLIGVGILILWLIDHYKRKIEELQHGNRNLLKIIVEKDSKILTLSDRVVELEGKLDDTRMY